MADLETSRNPEEESTGETGRESRPAKRTHSFDSVCGKCGALLPAGKEACLICGTSRDAVPFQGEFPVPAGETASLPYQPRQSGSARRTPEVWRRWGSGVIGAIMAVFLLFAGLNIYRLYFDTSSYRAAESVLYETDSHRLLLSHPGLERPLEVVGVERSPSGYSGTLSASPSGRWLSYTAKSGGLYLLDLSHRSAIDGDHLEAVKLASNLAQPAVFSDDNDYLVYLTKQESLFASDLSDVWQLDTGVAEVAAVEGSKVLYTRRGDRTGQLDLYINYIPNGSGEWYVVERSVVQVLDWTQGFEKLLYTSFRQDESGNNVLCLQQYDQNRSGSTTLVPGVGTVLDASAERGVVVFLMPRLVALRYGNFIDDDLLREDGVVREPDPADYPLIAGLVEREEDVDLSALEDNEEVLEQWLGYQDALKRWEDKQERDRLRQKLQSVFMGQNGFVELGDLYVFQNGTLTLLDEDVVGIDDLTREAGRVSAAGNYIAYQKVYPDSLQPLRMSELWDDPERWGLEPREYYYDGVERELRFSALNGQPVRLFVRGGGNEPKEWSVSSGGEGVYFTAGPAESGDKNALYYSAIKNGVPGTAGLIDREVAGIADVLRDGVLFRRADGSLQMAQNGSVRDLGDGGVGAYELVNGRATLLCLVYGEDAGGGDLYRYGRETVWVASGVESFSYRNDELIYFLRAVEKDRLDLYVYQSGKEKLINQDVLELLTSSVSDGAASAGRASGS